jgi:hypothetical protein
MAMIVHLFDLVYDEMKPLILADAIFYGNEYVCFASYLYWFHLLFPMNSYEIFFYLNYFCFLILYYLLIWTFLKSNLDQFNFYLDWLFVTLIIVNQIACFKYLFKMFIRVMDLLNHYNWLMLRIDIEVKLN